MAYEKVWNFPTPVSWTTATASNQIANILFNMKQLLVGNLTTGMASGGKWTVIGSSDSVTGAMDGVDRWLSVANVVYGGSATAPCGWVVLKAPYTVGPYSFPIYLCLASEYTSGATAFSVIGAYQPFGLNGTAATALPAAPAGTFMLNGSTAVYSNLVSSTNSPANFYGGITNTGEFWCGVTTSATVKMEFGCMIMPTIGAKSADQFPLYHWCYSNAGSIAAFDGSALWTTAGSTFQTTRGYNMTSGLWWMQITIPGMFTKSFLDTSDSSIWAFPAWVTTSNNSSYGGGSAFTFRGRIPDVAVIGGSSASNGVPCPIGSTVKDSGGNIKYSTVGLIMVPSNVATT